LYYNITVVEMLASLHAEYCSFGLVIYKVSQKRPTFLLAISYILPVPICIEF